MMTGLSRYSASRFASACGAAIVCTAGVLASMSIVSPPSAARAGDAPAGEKAAPHAIITDAARAHWAFQPIRRTTRPSIPAGAAGGNPIDSFILEKLQAKKLTFSPPAGKSVLIRRVTFDLLGLPPTPQEVDAFVADQSAGAYERLIDRLLASPHYGERWGRHWLDLARYAETDGFEHDAVRPNAWR